MNVYEPPEIKGRKTLLSFNPFLNCYTSFMLPILSNFMMNNEELKNVSLVAVQNASIKNKEEEIAYKFKLRQDILRHDFAKPVLIDDKNEIFSEYTMNNEKSLQFVLLNSSGEIISKYDSLNKLKSQIISDVSHNLDSSDDLQDWQFARKPIERLYQPHSVLFFPTFCDTNQTSIFVSDTHHNRIIQMDENGSIIDYMGHGQYGNDNGDFDEAKFARPHGVFFDKISNSLFVADTNNNMIRKVDLKERIVSNLLEPEKYPIEFEFANDPKPKLSMVQKLEKAGYLASEYIDFVELKAQMDTEKIFQQELPKGNPMYFLSTSKHLQNPYDLFFEENTNSLYVVEEAYQHIWKIPMDTGIVEDVLPIVLTQQKQFQLFKEKVHPNSIEFQKEIPNMKIEWEYLKMREKTSFFQVNNEIKHYINLESKIISGNQSAGFKDGKNAMFGKPVDSVLLNNSLFIPDTNNHVIRKLNLDNFETSTLQFQNLNKLGFQAMEYRPHLQEDGVCVDNYFYRGNGRIVEPTTLFIGNGHGLIELYIDPPEGYEFAEPIKVISTNSSDPILGYRENPELFEPEDILDDVDEEEFIKGDSKSDPIFWKDYLVSKRLYHELPDLSGSYPINLPIGTINGFGCILVDVVCFLKLKDDNSNNSTWENGPYEPNLPFALKPNTELLPLNLQTSHTYLYGKRDLTPAIMTNDESIQAFEDLRTKLKWNQQTSSSNPFPKQKYFKPNSKVIIVDPIQIILNVNIQDDFPLKTSIKLKSHAGPPTTAPHQFRRQFIPCQESFQKDNWKEGYFDIEEYVNI
eukprot:gene2514-3220_t